MLVVLVDSPILLPGLCLPASCVRLLCLRVCLCCVYVLVGVCVCEIDYVIAHEDTGQGAVLPKRNVHIFLARERAAPVSHFVWAFLSLLDPRFGMSWIGPLRVHNFAIAQVRSLVQAKRTEGVFHKPLNLNPGDFSINP